MNLGYIQVTRLCNQKCRICSNPERDATLGFAEVCSRIDDLVARGCEGIFLTGGEPTLHPELPGLIRTCRERGLHVRIITNAQKLAKEAYLAELVEAGLEHLHISIYSHRPDVQGFLSQNPDSFKNIEMALTHLGKAGLSVDVNTAINHYNADHLHELVRWVVENHAFVRHFVWDHLDPSMNRATSNPDVIPHLFESELSLKTAMAFLTAKNRTFRIERLPLCYMVDYAHCSTEARKIVKGEGRVIHFLDEKGLHSEQHWRYGKAPCCAECTLDEICPGLWEMDRYYDSKELHAVFVPKEPIIEKILKPH
jgi:MoaA/NifB/PqqE/SkfB family radical SAM enzyme